jgi:hypothetical protein
MKNHLKMICQLRACYVSDFLTIIKILKVITLILSSKPSKSKLVKRNKINHYEILFIFQN